MKKILSIIFLLAFTGLAQGQTIYYVNIGSGNDANSGTSWGNSFQNLTKALAAANASSDTLIQIWVAEGDYTPTDGISALPSDHRDTSFCFFRGSGIHRGLKVYGGFRGSESSVAARDTTHISYLDGVIGSLNSYHVGVIAGLAASADSVVIDGFTFNNGLASGRGAKVYNGISTSRSTGGGLLIQNDSTNKVAIRSCVFGFNTAFGVDNYGISTYGGDGKGGGAYLYRADCAFDKCTFTNNNSFGNRGITFGGSGLGGGICNEDSYVKLNNCSFKSNEVLGDFYYSSSGGGDGRGGGVCFINTRYSKVVNCNFNGNSALVANSYHYMAGSYGGAVCNTNSNIQYLKCVFSMNRTKDTGYIVSASSLHGAAVANIHFTGVFDSCAFSSNNAVGGTAAYGKGGGVYSFLSADTFYNCSMVNNHSSYGGTAVYADSATSVFDQCKFLHNGNGYGAGTIICGNSSVLIKNSSVNDNEDGVTNYQSFLTLVNDSFSNNTYGGISSTRATTTVSRCKITNNTTGIGISYSQFNMRSSVVSNNHDHGMDIAHSNPFIDSCLFDSNTGSHGGGILCLDSTVTIRHSVFLNNSVSGTGGAILLGDMYGVATNANFKSDGNVFINNSASKGGAIYANICSTCSDTLLNNVFIGNKSTGTGAANGGGALLVNGSRNYIYNNTFVSDTAVGRGGAIRLEGTGGLVKVANNIFYKSAGTSTSIDTSIAGSGTFLFSNNIYTGTNPQFRDSTNAVGGDGIWGTADDGLRLKSCSPAVNAGSNTYLVAGEAVDITGTTRLAEGTVDIGAYESNTIGAIAGPATLCLGSTTTYTDTTAGGSWVSSNTATATVSASGVVRALSTGTTTLSYTATSSCGGSITATKFIIVDRPVAVIVGADTICRGGTTLLTDTLSGGIWSSSNTALATVNASGLVTAIAAGLDTISYSIANACGTTTSIKRLLIQRPASLTVAGADTICRGSVHVYTDSVSGGVWTTSNTTVASISSTGSLTARAVGSDSVIYTLTNSCGTSLVYRMVRVERAPSLIVTPDSICIFSSATPSDSVSRGVWRLSNHMVLNLSDSVTGAYSALAAGRDTLSYVLTNSCGTNTVSKQIRSIGAGIGTITGPDSVCAGDSIILRDSVYAGGAWTSGAATIATINSVGVVHGIGAGSVILSYSLTNACGAATITHSVFVNTPPVVTVTGSSSSVCIGGVLTLTSSPTGGTWSAVNTNASVDIYGAVSGAVVGADTIKYSASNTCGTSVFAYPVTIMDVPSASPVSGPSTVCQYKSITLIPATGGGAWSTTAGNASVSSAGVVTGVNPGADNIVYTMSNVCGGSPFSYSVTVNSKDYCDSAAGVTGLNLVKPEIKVYPNPAADKLTSRPSKSAQIEYWQGLIVGVS